MATSIIVFDPNVHGITLYDPVGDLAAYGSYNNSPGMLVGSGNSESSVPRGEFRVNRRKIGASTAANNGYFDISATFASLGVTAGTTVSAIRAAFTYRFEFCRKRHPTQNSDQLFGYRECGIGPFIIYNSLGTVAATPELAPIGWCPPRTSTTTMYQWPKSLDSTHDRPIGFGVLASGWGLSTSERTTGLSLPANTSYLFRMNFVLPAFDGTGNGEISLRVNRIVLDVTYS